MAGNSLGQLFRISTFGESHGKAIGVIVDGCPPNLDFNLAFIQAELDKRRPGQSHIVTQRKESDTVQVLSGIFEGKTTGTPIALLIPNEDHRSKDYDHNKDIFRPSHADYTYQAKYGIRDHRGGGRSSARETAARVAAGGVAKIFLKKYGIEVLSHVSGVGTIEAPELKITSSEKFMAMRESTPIRCTDEKTATEMIALIEQIRKEGDTVGGRISCIIKGCPVGLGDPVFDKLHADLGKAMLSINAVHGFEYGSGFTGTEKRGSEHNDTATSSSRKGLETTTNHAGGILGGISNGMDILFRVGFKPVATIMHSQPTIDKEGNKAEISGRGRHDPCVVPRAVPIVEAMAALVIADHLLRHHSLKIS